MVIQEEIACQIESKAKTSCAMSEAGGGRPADSVPCASSRRGATDAFRDHPTGSGLQARLPRRTEERAATMKWLKELLLPTILLVL